MEFAQRDVAVHSAVRGSHVRRGILPGYLPDRPQPAGLSDTPEMLFP